MQEIDLMSKSVVKDYYSKERDTTEYQLFKCEHDRHGRERVEPSKIIRITQGENVVYLHWEDLSKKFRKLILNHEGFCVDHRL